MIQIHIRVHDGTKMHHCTLSSYPDLINKLRHENPELSDSDMIKMLGTGKHDRYGTLIYFGDIVEIVDKGLDSLSYYLVSYDNKHGGIVLTDKYDHVVYTEVNWKHVEVVGNYIDDGEFL